MLIYFHVIYGCFCTTAQWKSGIGNHTVSKFKILVLTLYRKCLQTLHLPTSSTSCLQSSSLFPFRSLIYLPLLLSLYVFLPWATSLSTQSRWPDVPPKTLTIGRISPQHSSWVTAEWDCSVSAAHFWLLHQISRQFTQESTLEFCLFHERVVLGRRISTTVEDDIVV